MKYGNLKVGSTCIYLKYITYNYHELQVVSTPESKRWEKFSLIFLGEFVKEYIGYKVKYNDSPMVIHTI